VATAAVLCAGVLLADPSLAAAGNGKTGSTTGASGGQTSGSSYVAQVSFTTTGVSADGRPITSSDVTYDPPVCWYTAMTPDEMRAEIKRRYDDAGARMAGTEYNFYNDQNNQMEDDGHYHQGQDGSWWVLTWDEERLNAGDYNCPYDEGYFWRDPGNPPAGAITPEILAGAAYKRLKLPPKAVTLSPNPQNQKVNLPTWVSFAGAGDTVSVTATLTEPNGQVIAATVAARPSRLKVDAGTTWASPQSCTYQMNGGALNSSNASCNITYRKSSNGGTYPFTSDLTWNVWWNPGTAARDGGTALPSGYSEYPEAVTVREIQSVNR
jgi:enoyl reductase